ncbi:uncharacterized protein LOC132544288 [Ylistrum balloti]|uniref:uncharacterized protein LOC132544288 n=1 Tax=Ylistrum balloti TaxID=509963 RepID=UPI002905C25C|nr:uncharacterized protein LOC132544288 [Ylistrum balloti]
MSSQSRKQRADAYLQRTNIELLNCVDEMRLKRDDLQKDIKNLKDEQCKLQYDLGMMTTQLTKINESLCKKLVERERFDSLITDYETAFNQLVSGSESLLANMRKTLGSIAPEFLTCAEDADQISTISRRSRSSRQSHSSAGSHANTRVDMSRGTSLPRVDTRASDSRSDIQTDNRVDTRTSQQHGEQ